MRDFCDDILAFIGAESLTEDEWSQIESDSLTLTVDLYNELKNILIARNAVNSKPQRLFFYFQAAGISVSEPVLAKSNVFMGSGLAN